MAKKTKTVDNEIMAMTNHDIQVLRNDYRTLLDTEPRYSLTVDPEHKYNFTPDQLTFIKFYVDYKNIETVSTLMDIDVDAAKMFFMNSDIQSEIRRLNLALYHYQFSQKMMDLDELGGFLTCQLTGEGVPQSEQLSPRDKLKCAELIKDLNVELRKSIQNPGVIIAKDFEMELKDLSVETISQLINQSEKGSAEKQKAIAAIENNNSEALTSEEKAYLQSLSPKQLLEMLDETNKK